jgi:nitrile hydratase
MVDGMHDLGGMHGFGPVRTPDGDLAYHESWELRAQFIGLLSKVSGGTMRPNIEQLSPAEYLASSYYVRWLAAAEQLHLRVGAVTESELEGWRQRFEDDPDLPVPRHENPELARRVVAMLSAGNPLPKAASPLFDAGESVVVRRIHPETHHRCPRYVRGARGAIEMVCGDDRVPGAAPGDNQVEAVYTVRFDSVDLWGVTDEPPFVVLVDLWQGYLEAA